MTDEDRKIVADEAIKLSKIIPYSYDEYIEFMKSLMKQHPFSYFSIAKSLRFNALWKDILEKTTFIDNIDNFKPNTATRIFYYINKLTELKKCETCGKDIIKDISPIRHPEHFFCCNRCAQLHDSTIAKTKETKLKNHGDPNWNNMEKNRQTCRDKYGVEYSWQADVTKQKSKETLLRNYGVDHQMRSKEVIEGMKARYKEAHGVEYSFQDPEVLKKIKAKNQENLGVDYPMQNKELHKVMHEHSARTQSTNFYNNVLLNDPQYEVLFPLDEWLEHGGKKDFMHEYLWRCKKCGKEFKSKVMWGSWTYVRCYDCYPVIKDTSIFEKEVADFVQSLGKFQVLNHVRETRQIISPKEIDIVVKDPSGKIVLGIECDGLYWHSAVNGVDKIYHLNKTEACLKKDIQLVHVFEDEWCFKRDIVKSRISSLLGIYNERVFARKCEIKEVSSKEAKKFFDTNHLQGHCNAKVTFGLQYSGEYVAMMSFGMPRKIVNKKNEKDSWELLRFACKLNVNVIGGASKLLSHFEKSFNPKRLTSFADRRWSIGRIYSVLGFTLDHVSEPNYWYLDQSMSKRIYRYAFAKYKLKDLLPKFDPALTEMQNMKENGWTWIWDCGNYVYVKTY